MPIPNISRSCPVYRFRVTADLPDLDLRVGDVLIYDPSDLRDPFILARAITANAGRLLSAFVDGDLESLDITPAAWSRARETLSPPRVLPMPSRGG